MTKGIALFLLLLFTVCLVGYVRAKFGQGPRAGSTPADDSGGGFATPRQVHDRLSAHAVRASGSQVRPGLPEQEIEQGRKRKGTGRGTR